MQAELKPDHIAAIVFLDMAVILLLAQSVGALFRRIGQPPVVGEILAGIILGPSVLGALPGDLPDRIFVPEVRPFLNVLAQLGLIIFMFTIGMEFDLALVRARRRAAAVISVCSVVVPFGGGLLLATSLHSSHNGPPNARNFVSFALFIGVAMSITAFPVLARILTERGLYRTEVGVLALACAAVDDVIAWSVLALVVAIVAATGISDFLLILAEAFVYVLFMLFFVRPRLQRLAERHHHVGNLNQTILSGILVGLLMSAFTTSAIGIHAIFGAFLFGVILPRKNTADLFRQIGDRLEQVGSLLLLPIFFIVTGLNVDVRGLGRDAITQLPLILVVAVAGKFLGAAVAARLQRVERRKAAAIGVLMNTRGLTELVILNVGREVGVLDQRLFTMLVVMAVVTTVMTQPLLRLIYPTPATSVGEAEPSDREEADEECA